MLAVPPSAELAHEPDEFIAAWVSAQRHQATPWLAQFPDLVIAGVARDPEATAITGRDLRRPGAILSRAASPDSALPSPAGSTRPSPARRCSSFLSRCRRPFALRLRAYRLCFFSAGLIVMAPPRPSIGRRPGLPQDSLFFGRGRFSALSAQPAVRCPRPLRRHFLRLRHAALCIISTRLFTRRRGAMGGVAPRHPKKSGFTMISLTASRREKSQ